jgi:hypothetical protein
MKSEKDGKNTPDLSHLNTKKNKETAVFIASTATHIQKNYSFNTETLGPVP